MDDTDSTHALSATDDSVSPPAGASGADNADGFIEIDRGDTVWRFEREFLTSNWTCLYGNGCQGILTEPAEDLKQGCCSLGAHFGDGPAGQSEAMQVHAYSAMLTPQNFQHYAVANETETDTEANDTQANESGPSDTEPSDTEPNETEANGIFGDAARTHTRVVDGACIFLNRPGFDGGEGCALHIAALEFDESPTEWKPSVCWQLPLRIDWQEVDGDTETATVRRWTRADWGKHGTTMAWCCTERSEGGEAYSGTEQVIDSMRDELTALASEEVYVELRARLAPES